MERKDVVTKIKGNNQPDFSLGIGGRFPPYLRRGRKGGGGGEGKGRSELQGDQ